MTDLRSECRAHRDQWFEAEGPDAVEIGDHGEACVVCAAWQARQQRLVGALKTLDLLVAPEELDQRLAAQLDELKASARTVETLASESPSAKAKDAEDVPAFVRALQALERFPAPAVLDRLVAEELAEPQRAQTSRFIGSLPRQMAPAVLQHRTQEQLARRVPSRAFTGLVAAGLGAILVWFFFEPVSGGVVQAGGELARHAQIEIGDLVSSGSSGSSGSTGSTDDERPEIVIARPNVEELAIDDVDDTQVDPVTRRLARALLPSSTGRALSDEEEEEDERLRRGWALSYPLVPTLPVPVEVEHRFSSTPGSSGGTVRSRVHELGSVRPAQPVPVEVLLSGSWINAPDVVKFSGTRLIEVFDRSGSEVLLSAYREDVISAGDGRFAIDPFEVVASGDPASLLISESRRKGYSFEYRHFAVRDTDLFAQQYQVLMQGAAVVAGRAGTTYRVSSTNSHLTRELVIDDATKLMLEESILNANGQLLAHFVYESIDFQPDLGGVVYHTTTNREAVLDADGDLRSQAGFPVFSPRLVPTGFQLLRAATVRPISGRPWLKLTYTDGAELLFFLHEAKIGAGFRQADASLLETDRFMQFQVGDSSVLTGNVGARRFMIAGRLGTDDLLDLLENTF